MEQTNKWVSIWGNVVSVAENRPERYAKNITIRYPIHIPFSGRALRLTFENYCGTEPTTLAKTSVFSADGFLPSASAAAGRLPSPRVTVGWPWKSRQSC